nr:hypothetical protein [Sphingomonas melonis]
MIQGIVRHVAAAKAGDLNPPTPSQCLRQPVCGHLHPAGLADTGRQRRV